MSNSISKKNALKEKFKKRRGPNSKEYTFKDISEFNNVTLSEETLNIYEITRGSVPCGK